MGSACSPGACYASAPGTVLVSWSDFCYTFLIPVPSRPWQFRPGVKSSSLERNPDRFPVFNRMYKANPSAVTRLANGRSPLTREARTWL